MHLGQLHSAFDATALFTHQYYLPQPQSYKTTGSSTPGSGAEKFNDSNDTEIAEDTDATYIVEDTDEPGTGIFVSLERPRRKPVTEESEKYKGSTTDKGKNSNDSWDLDVMLKDWMR